MQADLAQVGAVGGAVALVLIVGDRVVNWAVKLRGKEHVIPSQTTAGAQTKDYYDAKFDRIEEGNQRLLEELKGLRQDLREVLINQGQRIASLESKLSFIQEKHLSH